MVGDEPPAPRAESRGGMPPGDPYEFHNRLDRLHEEMKALRVAITERDHKVDKKFIEVDFELGQHKQSLNSGAQRFSAIEAKIMPKWGTIVGIVAAAFTLIWMASRYPDENKFSDLQKEVRTMQIDQALVQKTLSDQGAALLRLEDKLDRALKLP